MSKEPAILDEGTETPRVRVLLGDCLEVLRGLPARSVHCVVTSPPYWGLRDYGIPPTHWEDGSVCCFGLEPTPELFVQHAVAIFREVHRVLRDDGTLWVNLGDSYNGAGTTGGTAAYEANGSFSVRGALNGKATNVAGLKQGDMVGIPWRVALALQADGWWLRRDNIWHKPACMPESVNGWRWERCRVKVKPQEQGSQRSAQIGPRSRDMSQGEYIGGAVYEDCEGCAKCEPHGGMVLRKGAWRTTTAHEYVFQFSKKADYFCDAEAAKEAASPNTHSRGHGVNPKAKENNKGSRQNASFSGAVNGAVTMRNRRSVWRVNTKPFKGAHFATFPPDLVRPVIQAATPIRCCAGCGAPWAPVLGRGQASDATAESAEVADWKRACGADAAGGYTGKSTKDHEAHGVQDASAVKARILAGMGAKQVVGYAATCRCRGAGTARAVVLDIFGGSGTVGQVALEEDRDGILIELNPEYGTLIDRRLEKALDTKLDVMVRKQAIRKQTRTLPPAKAAALEQCILSL